MRTPLKIPSRSVGALVPEKVVLVVMNDFGSSETGRRLACWADCTEIGLLDTAVRLDPERLLGGMAVLRNSQLLS